MMTIEKDIIHINNDHRDRYKSYYYYKAIHMCKPIIIPKLLYKQKSIKHSYYYDININLKKHLYMKV